MDGKRDWGGGPILRELQVLFTVAVALLSCCDLLVSKSAVVVDCYLKYCPILDLYLVIGTILDSAVEGPTNCYIYF